MLRKVSVVVGLMLIMAVALMPANAAVLEVRSTDYVGGHEVAPLGEIGRAGGCAAGITPTYICFTNLPAGKRMTTVQILDDFVPYIGGWVAYDTTDPYYAGGVIQKSICSGAQIDLTNSTWLEVWVEEAQYRCLPYNTNVYGLASHGKVQVTFTDEAPPVYSGGGW